MAPVLATFTDRTTLQKETDIMFNRVNVGMVVVVFASVISSLSFGEIIDNTIVVDDETPTISTSVVMTSLSDDNEAFRSSLVSAVQSQSFVSPVSVPRIGVYDVLPGVKAGREDGSNKWFVSTIRL